MIRTLSALVAGICLALGASAQQHITFHDDGDPATGFDNAFPFGSEGVRTQQVFPGAQLGGPVLIQDLFVAPSLDRNRVYQESEVAYADIEIRMGAASGSLTTNWATNIPSPTTVYRGPMRITFRRDRWSPIGLPAPFLWVPTSPADDLAIEFILWDVADTGAIPPDINGYFMNVRTSTARNIPRAFLRNWTTNQQQPAQSVDGGGVKVGLLLNDGNFVAHGGACVGTSGRSPQIGTTAGTWPQLGGAVTIDLMDGPISGGAALTFGLDATSLSGVPLPFELTTVGAPGCFIWHDQLVALAGLPTNATGGLSVTLAIGNDPGLLGLRLFSSWLCLDFGSNALHVTISGYATLILGT